MIYSFCIGGMGLLGIIIEAKLKLLKYHLHMLSKKYFIKNISETIEILEKEKNSSDFSVAWLIVSQEIILAGVMYH